ncbi:LysE family translocator [Actinophytocola algeriensis]|uniref:Threonine/homoserine/homoserine lactone efflux protein n=1 Tax=Actinophytocola algeriensis TaxID=1768010 RepID=A0A7W7Q0C1_9PSEU|nr:LysE family translocator [Actinophytocola algeriensis]MBB4904466.1 threonine/homoserine/homoserine lactone efflux protein [Actinophytocola algeriensis]MBE1476675.1 threonine/homoserine/homoserine lactone efflux protein [Actinophytocola algeriensis]
MMSLSQVLAFALLSVVIVAVPGPSVLFTIGRALTVGRREALLTVVGNAIGVYLQVVAVAVGVGVVVERSAAVFTVIKLVGAAYLVYLGVQAIRHRRKVTEALAEGVPTVLPSGRALRDGIVVGVANPKSIVFFVVALPQFTDPAAGHVPVQMMVLGALFPVIAVVLDSVWALLAATARVWFSRSPRRLELVGGTGGLMMIGLGASIAVTGRKD